MDQRRIEDQEHTEQITIDLAQLATEVEKHIDHEVRIKKHLSTQSYHPDQLIVVCNTCQLPLFTTYSVYVEDTA